MVDFGRESKQTGRLIIVAMAMIALSSSGCSNDDGSANGVQCGDDELYDQVNDTCVPRFGDPPEDTGGGTDTGETPDTGEGDEDTSTVDPDADDRDSTGTDDTSTEDTGPDPNCDKDGDGAKAESCGGLDCDDDDRQRSPTYSEFCDSIDNNCSGEVNDNITCTFYAHSSDELYEVDPFAKTATKIEGAFDANDNGGGLLDFDTHPDGTLFGIDRDGLHRYDSWDQSWIDVGEYGQTIENPYGMAIDEQGDAYIIAGDQVYTVDLTTGAASLVGDMEGNFVASGDCVVNKRNTLFMTSKHDETEDHLVTLSKTDGTATGIGPIGYTNVFGLTSAWGQLYGLTVDGHLISIDPTTGQSTLIHQFNDIAWFGAASTPSR